MCMSMVRKWGPATAALGLFAACSCLGNVCSDPFLGPTAIALARIAWELPMPGGLAHAGFARVRQPLPRRCGCCRGKAGARAGFAARRLPGDALALLPGGRSCRAAGALPLRAAKRGHAVHHGPVAHLWRPCPPLCRVPCGRAPRVALGGTLAPRRGTLWPRLGGRGRPCGGRGARSAPEHHPGGALLGQQPDRRQGSPSNRLGIGCGPSASALVPARQRDRGQRCLGNCSGSCSAHHARGA
mmetsp:Transcript_53451/g.114935  ORF Transcript_53451/g.114935 Transcript_53451/m.114935 type:complete len:242 (-) Transcript_53451:1040-1765(-)